MAEVLCTWRGHSCGGCCNDFSRPRQELSGRFGRRARVFPAAEATREEALRCFQLELGLVEGNKECKFLAFLDSERRRVGCLIHPRRLGGLEMRDLGPFGAGLCAGSFCPPAARFDPRRVEPALELLAEGADWYEYSRLFSRFVSAGPHAGLYEVLSSWGRPLLSALLGRGIRPERGLEACSLLLARLLGLPAGRVFEAEGLARLRAVAELPAAVLEREVARLWPATGC